jgi:hypothetical protein
MRSPWSARAHRLPVLVAGIVGAGALTFACFGQVAPIRSKATDGDATTIDASDVGVRVPFDGKAPTACSTTTPDPSAIYVSLKSGIESGACTRKAPCSSLKLGLEQSVTRSISVVNIAEGTYDEAITLHNGATTLVGGWIDEGGAWTKDPMPDARARTTLEPASGTMTVLAEGLLGSSTLCGLTIRTKPVAAPGETLYGVFVSGISTGAPFSLVLDDVAVAVSSGGDGATGSTGPVGSNGSSVGCDGFSPGNGTPGMSGAPGPSGAFTSSGYVAGDGDPGKSGTPGGNGTAGIAGACCKNHVCIDIEGCVVSTTMQLCGTQGKGGCGGGAGQGGSPGQGGGSSIAVFAWGGVVVGVSNSSLVAGTAGNGGEGGKGGDGGIGAGGVSGAAVMCCKGCSTSGTCMCTGYSTGAGGTAGGSGGNGGPGGLGGGGAGGSSCAVVHGGSASVSLEASDTLSVGTAGVGAGGAPGGQSNEICAL